MDRLLFIGRFQPFHLGHLSVVNKFVKKTQYQLVIGIGSSNGEYLTDKNPFTFSERKGMIDAVLKDHGINIEIFGIPDFPDNNEMRRKYIEETMAPDKVISGNPIVKSIFSDKILELHNRYEDISATYIREIINMGGDISSYVPKLVLDYMKNNNLYDRVHKVRKIGLLENPDYNKNMKTI